MIYYKFFKKICIFSLFIVVSMEITAESESSLVETSIPIEDGAYSQQKIKDFYLTNYTETGSQDWEVRGKEAVIYGEFVDILKMDTVYYAKDDVITIQSQKAKLNKKNMNILLKEEVQIENKAGMKLVTDSLNWQRDKNQITTDDDVKVTNNSAQITAKGLFADTELQTIDFKENVEVLITDEKTGEITVITCTGPLKIKRKQEQAVFKDNVIVKSKQGKLFADKVTVYFDVDQKQLLKIVSKGNVRIIKDENITLSQTAVYFEDGQRLILGSNPRVIYFSSKNEAS